MVVESATSGCVGDRGPTTTATVAVTISTPAGELLPDDRFQDISATFVDAFAESLAETPGITDYGSFGQASTGELEVWCFMDEPPQTAAGRVDDAVTAAVQATQAAPRNTIDAVVISCEKPELALADASTPQTTHVP